MFLTTGEALPTFGDSAQVGDRLVFNLMVGSSDGTSLLQLMSVPLASIDLLRTRRYAEAVRASNYAATRGQADYAAVTAEVSSSLDALRQVSDPQRRLQMAQDARRRLQTWSRDHYDYRAAEVQELTRLFDDVVAELRAAAGEPAIALDLRAGAPSAGSREPILGSVSLADSVKAALAAASATDVTEDRMAVLRTAMSAVAAERGPAELSREVSARLADELRVEEAYRALGEDLLGRAEAALGRGDVPAIEALLRDLPARDRALGVLRPAQVRDLELRLAALLDRTRAHRVGLDHFSYIRPRLLAYQRRLAPALAELDRLSPLFGAIRDMHSVRIGTLTDARTRLRRLTADLEAISPPAYLADVHATLESALHMASQAAERRRLAVVTNAVPVAREASSAAAGAIILLERARADLRQLLQPPTLK